MRKGLVRNPQLASDEPIVLASQAAGADLGDRQFQVPGLGGHHFRPVAVARRRACIGVLPRLRADVGGGLGFDEFLQDPFAAAIKVAVVPASVTRLADPAITGSVYMLPTPPVTIQLLLWMLAPSPFT